MARPTAVPRMPDSASGESITRSSPKSFCRPSVIRKTPPSLPTSSPMIRTLGSSSIALRRPALSALASVTLVIALAPSRLEGVEVGRELRLLLDQLVGLLGEDVVEDQPRVGVAQGLAALAQVRAEVGGLLLERPR